MQIVFLLLIIHLLILFYPFDNRTHFIFFPKEQSDYFYKRTTMRSAIHRLFALLLILLLVESVHCEEVSEKIPDFIPTEEYQEVLPGQKVPLVLASVSFSSL